MSDLTGKTHGVRFSAEIDALIQRVADKTGQTRTEVIRTSTATQLKQPSLEFLLKQLELRILRRNFEINCIIVGLTEEQRAQAILECNRVFGQEVIQ